MSAPQALVEWLSSNQFVDRNRKLPPGLVIQYHSRSDDHSKYLGRCIAADLVQASSTLRQHAKDGRVAFAINLRYTWPNGKTKTLDLAIGLLRNPLRPLPEGRIHEVRGRDASFSRLFVACEEKSTMTEHGKSQPRIYSELNDSHTIVHQGAKDTIAAGITMVNIAKTFISPLRQARNKEIEISVHDQPRVTQSMVEHLRRLPLRDHTEQVGLDAYCTFVVDVDNQGHVALWTRPPAPQPGDQDEYSNFVARIAGMYEERYSDLDALPALEGLSIEEMLSHLAHDNPNLLREVSKLAIDAGLDGAEELTGILESVENRVNPLTDPENE